MLPFAASVGCLHPAIFAPVNTVDASSPTLFLDGFGATSGFTMYDIHLSLMLFLPASLLSGILPRILVLDPASRRRALLLQPPRDTLPNDRWRSSRRHFVGATVLSHAHPSKLCFDAICLTVDNKHPRAWVASYRDGDCSWRALPWDTGVTVEFDLYWFEGRSVHAAWDIYWHICHSGHLLKLDPATLHFSDLLAPSELGGQPQEVSNRRDVGGRAAGHGGREGPRDGVLGAWGGQGERQRSFENHATFT
ncbi:hypothetical protein E2562_032353, partial [Oryza meyeriana var. granulata]